MLVLAPLLELHLSVSGAIVKKVCQNPTIIRNDRAQVRQRFTCGHELGHYVLRSDDPDEYEFVDHDTLSSTGQSPDEVFANVFAECPLMPEGEVRARHGKGASAVDLAWQFRVSHEAMQFRLTNLGLR